MSENKTSYKKYIKSIPKWCDYYDKGYCEFFIDGLCHKHPKCKGKNR